jgi:hypothetical protein
VKFLYGNKAISSFLRKNVTLPTLSFSCKNFVETQGFIISKCKSTKFVSWVLWTCVYLAYLPWSISQPSVASTTL